jgi:hypothetical protein
MTLFDQGSEMLLQGVPAGACQADGIGHGDSAMLTGKLNYLQGQFGEHSQDQFLPLDLLVQTPHLLGQRPQEE